jgi:hypothetical protein
MRSPIAAATSLSLLLWLMKISAIQGLPLPKQRARQGWATLNWLGDVGLHHSTTDALVADVLRVPGC